MYRYNNNNSCRMKFCFLSVVVWCIKLIISLLHSVYICYSLEVILLFVKIFSQRCMTKQIVKFHPQQCLIRIIITTQIQKEFFLKIYIMPIEKHCINKYTPWQDNVIIIVTKSLTLFHHLYSTHLTKHF